MKKHFIIPIIEMTIFDCGNIVAISSIAPKTNVDMANAELVDAQNIAYLNYVNVIE